MILLPPLPPIAGFQLPLSGSRVWWDERVRRWRDETFNSLSRDHDDRLRADEIKNIFQLPLSGSHGNYACGRLNPDVDCFQLPLSGSRPSPEARHACGDPGCGFQLPLSGSRPSSSSQVRRATWLLPFNSLSRDHLFVQVLKAINELAFNSLSRDHSC